MIPAIVDSEAFVYKYLKDVLFLADSEPIHERMAEVGEVLAKISPIRDAFKSIHYTDAKILNQKIHGVYFPNPIGLAAGFDYKARLTNFLPSLGFGFGSIGTITYQAYGGNPKPLLGRLPKSQSLMVNKGFKNDGIEKVTQKLKNRKFPVPVGISIGRTNTTEHKSQKEAIADIMNAFEILIASKIPFGYQELNISCPNLFGNISFYPPGKLDELLKNVDKLKLKKPLFIKMPINESDRDVVKMLEVISKHNVQGTIFGNLQKDRKHPLLNKQELKKYKVGNFSGKPTFERSNELIQLAYKKYGNKLTIIGCGGVFNADDAFKKITLGANLVQLITGLIFQGPQLPAQINTGLIKILEKEGFKNISDAVGAAN